jgi:hypothetical protein
MIKDFKFFKGSTGAIVVSTPRGGYYDRTIDPNLYNRTTLDEPSDRVQQIVSDPNYEPANYIEVNGSFYDSVVINRVRTSMRQRINWRGYECWLAETDGYTKLKIVSGINIGGMFHIVYLITRDGNTENYRVSVPLVNLQRRG